VNNPRRLKFYHEQQIIRKLSGGHPCISISGIYTKHVA